MIMILVVSYAFAWHDRSARDLWPRLDLPAIGASPAFRRRISKPVAARISWRHLPRGTLGSCPPPTRCATASTRIWSGKP